LVRHCKPQQQESKYRISLSALTDIDRMPWLETLNKLAVDQLGEEGAIIACSALKHSYREILSRGIEPQTRWVHLKGEFELIYDRINQRKGHFMSTELLRSQFATLEEPVSAMTMDIKSTPKEITRTIKEKLMGKSEFGLLGLGVMGKSLARNLAGRGFRLSIFNRHVTGKEENVAARFLKEHHELATAQPYDQLEDFVNSLELPRKIMLMVNAGKTIDLVIEELLPHLSEGDIIIDGGNSNYLKTSERAQYLKTKNINHIGCGVSGGEEGALKGPSIMPGGNSSSYKAVAPYLNAIAAKDENDQACCTYIGPEGSGHFVKMIHNGVEYAEMQLLCEVYGILKSQDKNQDEIADYLNDWKKDANSYLLEITVDILKTKEGDGYLLEKIMDKAGNKGTGNWATVATAQLGVPSTMIASALFARYASFYKDERVKLNELYPTEKTEHLKISSEHLLEAYRFCRIINHYQGFKIITEASNKYDWNLNLSEIARIWTNGCIIRSTLMKELVGVLDKTHNLLHNKIIIKRLTDFQSSLAKVVSQSVLAGRPIPCMSEALNFFNMITTARSSANLIQAQRDYFGAHTYQRTDDNSGKFYHTNWKSS